MGVPNANTRALALSALLAARGALPDTTRHPPPFCPYCESLSWGVGANQGRTGADRVVALFIFMNPRAIGNAMRCTALRLWSARTSRAQRAALLGTEHSTIGHLASALDLRPTIYSALVLGFRSQVVACLCLFLVLVPWPCKHPRLPVDTARC
jgi:hypothetical protein